MLMERRIERISELLPEIDTIQDKELAAKVAQIWAEVWAESKFAQTDLGEMERNLSADKTAGNLIAHVRGVVHMCCAIASVIEKEVATQLNYDYLIASALLHDAAAPAEFELPYGKSRLGQFTPHSAYAVAKCFEKNIPLEIIHAVASHSPNASAKPPATILALIIYYADHAIYDAVQMSEGHPTIAARRWK